RVSIIPAVTLMLPEKACTVRLLPLVTMFAPEFKLTLPSELCSWPEPERTMLLPAADVSVRLPFTASKLEPPLYVIEPLLTSVKPAPAPELPRLTLPVFERLTSCPLDACGVFAVSEVVA